MAIPGPDPKLFDDLARVAGGAVNIFSGVQEQIRNDIRARVEEMATRLDLVPRDELDQAVGMIEKLRKQVQTLEQRLDAIEGKKAKPAPAKKTAPKKAAAKTRTTTARKKK